MLPASKHCLAAWAQAPAGDVPAGEGTRPRILVERWEPSSARQRGLVPTDARIRLRRCQLHGRTRTSGSAGLAALAIPIAISGSAANRDLSQTMRPCRMVTTSSVAEMRRCLPTLGVRTPLVVFVCSL